jgi:Flp pilus assembly protein TadB
VFFCCVYQSLSDFFLGETFSSRRTERERRKRSHLQKEKKDNKNNTRETRERKKKTKERFREILRRETQF